MKNIFLYIISCGSENLSRLESFTKYLTDNKNVNLLILFEYDIDYNLFVIYHIEF